MVHPIWDNQPLLKEQLNKVQRIMLNELTPTHPEVMAMVKSYIQSSGKFIRAGICLLFAQLNNTLDERTLYRAASIETLHLATLIHDDVIDQAQMRRNLVAFHQQFDNRIAIYAGDYLLAYSARLAKKGYIELKSSSINERVLELILSGELRQLMNQFDNTLTIENYLKQIRGKTAQLFALSAQSGVIHEDCSPKRLQQAYQAGMALGMAFQLQDDLIDYVMTSQKSGKPRFQDVQNGIYTAPLLFAKQTNCQVEDLLKQSVWHEDTLNILYDSINQSGGIDQTKQLITKYLNRFDKRVVQLFGNKAKEQLNDILCKLF